MKNSELNHLIEECKDYTVSRLNRNIVFLRFLMLLANPLGVWLADILIWVAVWSGFIWLGLLDLSIAIVTFFFCIHFVYWEFYQKKVAKKLMDDLGDIDLIKAIKVLKEVKEEKKKKRKNETD